jgi:hypothetical protein
VPRLRFLLGFYYVSRTTHYVVISRLHRECKEIIGAGG